MEKNCCNRIEYIKTLGKELFQLFHENVRIERHLRNDYYSFEIDDNDLWLWRHFGKEQINFLNINQNFTSEDIEIDIL